MKMPRFSSPRVLALSGCGVLALAVTSWGVSAHFWARPKAAPPPDPAQIREQLHRTDLTEEQRHKLFESMRETREAEIDAEVEEYYAAAPEDKERILDRQIDKMQDEWKQRQAEHEKEAETHRDAQRDDGPTTRPHRGGFGNTTPQERKMRSETRNPDQMARRMAYFSALRARMGARGIQGPWGGGGHGPGGFGGGHGGGRH
jgi:hypothetical protein